MIKVLKEKDNVVSLQDYKDKIQKQDAEEFQKLTIATLNDEIDELLNNLEKKFDNKEDYIVKLFEIKDYLRKLVKC